MTIDIRLEFDCKSLNGESPRWPSLPKDSGVDSRPPLLGRAEPLHLRRLGVSDVNPALIIHAQGLRLADRIETLPKCAEL